MKGSHNARFLAAVVLLCGALAFTALWSPGGEVLLRGDLTTLPVEIGSWRGKDIVLSQEVLDIAGVDDYLLRIYAGPEGAQTPPVSLYVGFYRTQRKGRTYHSPRNCLPGSGWELIDMERVPISLSGKTYIINKVLIQKGLEKQLVLYWYQDRGRIIASEYWAKFYLVYDSIKRSRSDGAMVRVIAPISADIEETFSYEKSFIKAFFPYLTEYLPE